jgi:hypothetical protein
VSSSHPQTIEDSFAYGAYDLDASVHQAEQQQYGEVVVEGEDDMGLSGGVGELDEFSPHHHQHHHHQHEHQQHEQHQQPHDLDIDLDGAGGSYESFFPADEFYA